MQLRCSYCQTMFALNREAVQAAYDQMLRENLHHFDAYCPKCRRAVYVTRQQFERFNPWLLHPAQERAAAGSPPAPAKAPAVSAAKPVKPLPEKRAAVVAAKAAKPKNPAADRKK